MFSWFLKKFSSNKIKDVEMKNILYIIGYILCYQEKDIIEKNNNKSLILTYINDNYNNLPKSLLESLELKRDIMESDLDDVLTILFNKIDYAQINKYILSSLNFDNIEKDDYIKNLIKNLFKKSNKKIKYQYHIIDVNVYYFLNYILNQLLKPKLNSNLINDVLKYLEKVPEELSSKIDKQKINNEQITETISNYLHTILNNLKNINYYNFDEIILNEINSLDLSLENKKKLKKFFKKKGFNLIIQKNFNADALSIADKIDTYWAPKRPGKQF